MECQSFLFLNFAVAEVFNHFQALSIHARAQQREVVSFFEFYSSYLRSVQVGLLPCKIEARLSFDCFPEQQCHLASQDSGNVHMSCFPPMCASFVQSKVEVGPPID